MKHTTHNLYYPTRRRRLGRWARHTAADIRYTLADVWLEQRSLIIAALLIAAVFAILARGSAGGSGPLGSATATPALPIIIATPLAVVQVDQDARPALMSAVVAYDAPGGAVLGAIEPGRRYTVVARYGADWTQLDVAGSGLVWVRTNDLLYAFGELANLEPPAALQVVYVAAPAAQAPAIEAAPAQAVPTAAIEPAAVEWHPPMAAPGDSCAAWHAPLAYPVECEAP